MFSGRLLSYWKKRKISRNGHSLSLVVICCHSLYHLLYHSLPFLVTHCHSLSFVVTGCTTRCHSLYRSLYHSLSFVVTRCHSLSLVVPLAVTRCTIRLSFYKRSQNRFYLINLNTDQIFEIL